ncbi:MAG: hypothetical protein IJK63_04125 [Oscillospiraceae bacterium]|nr:hypothetical protein [Oscillospiraceae bacterium]
MKKLICLLLALCMLFALAACGAEKEAPAEESPAPAEPEIKDWTRAGYFQDEAGDMLSVTWMEDIDEPGWYVGVMIGELMAGGTLPQEGNALHGNLSTWEEGAEPIVVTVSEEGEDGLLLVIEGGESYHFTPYEMPEATIVVNINTEGMGNIDWAEGEEAPEIDPDFPYQSAYIGLAEPKVHTFVAWPQAGSVFVKWTKNGEDFSTEPQITVLLDESAEFVAVFEEDPDWQNPVMNFVGEYQCDRAHALVECSGSEDAHITITWGSSACESAQWDIVGRLDLDTLTVSYSGCTKSILTYGDGGELVSQVTEYEDGTGTITFHDDGTFTWHEDQSVYGTDMLFQWAPVNPAPVRQDGERYEAVITLEGMEETVRYEHIVNETLGFEMDYDYERFERYTSAETESFLSVWDGPGNPVNYLEVTYRAEDPETAAASVRAELSQEYDLYESTRVLDGAGECLYIEASVVKGTNNMADQLQAVYIIPASEGCFVATAHYEAVAAEGMAKRFAYMLNTFSVR